CRGRDRDSDRLELLERLAAGVAVADRPAGRRAEDVLEVRLRRAAVRAAERLRLELHELRWLGGTRGRRGDAGRAQLLAAGLRDPVGRPRVAGDDLHVGFAA